MTDRQLTPILPRPTDDKIKQSCDVYFEARNLAYKAIDQGYDPSGVADGLFETARDILGTNETFMTVFQRFWAGWNLRKPPKKRHLF